MIRVAVAVPVLDALTAAAASTPSWTAAASAGIRAAVDIQDGTGYKRLERDARAIAVA